MLFYGWLALLAIPAVPLLLLPRGPTFRLLETWCGGVLWLLRVVAGIDHRVVGAPARGAMIYAVKHQSAWDTIVLPVLLRRAAFVLKEELLRLPFYGWYARKLGNIGVARETRASALRRMLPAAERARGDGRAIVIYPEGTRVAPGERRALLPGVYALYRALDLPVVPVMLDSGWFWPAKGRPLRAGRITLSFLDPLPTGLDRAAFMTRLAAALDARGPATRAEEAARSVEPAGRA